MSLKREEVLERVSALRRGYRRVRDALPWLDASVWEDQPPAFPGFAAKLNTDCARTAPANPALAPQLRKLWEQPIRMIRLAPRQHALESCGALLEGMEALGMPLVVLHTDLGFSGLRALVAERPRLNIILESGPRKLIYHLKEVKELLSQTANVHLCTYNFANWRGHEELVEMGLGSRLLYGSHWPLYSADAAMGPIVMGNFSWEIKCAIAGNNLRRLLGLPPVMAAEVGYSVPAPFIIDAHAHNLQPGAGGSYAMLTPDLKFTPADWRAVMDAIAFDRLFLIPGEVLDDPGRSSRQYTAELRRGFPGRFSYFEVFHPAGDSAHRRRLLEAHEDPDCVGIKIHPVMHKTVGDDEAYAHVYEVAARFKKTIMTHSWEISDYNPEQYRAHPDRFRRYLPKLNGLPFVLGHAGGRPSAFAAVAGLCRDFPGVHVDLAGDYFHNGVVDALAAALGHHRVLFATDVDWFDPRCNLAMALGCGLPDDQLADVLRLNAERVYGS